MISYGKQSIDESDIAAVTEVLRGQPLTCGPVIDVFEEVIRQISGAPNAVAVSNGTSALRLLYQVAGIGPGKRVAVPDLTFVATASQALLLGADIILLDVDPDSLVVTPEIVNACREPFDYLIAVDMAGRLCDLAGLAKVCKRRGAILLQDAAHSFGSTASDGTRSGDCRHAAGAIFSFHPVKNITTAEGGAIVVSDDAWDRKLRSLRHHGIIKKDFTGPLFDKEQESIWYHEFHHAATNERLSDVHAALGVSQCKRITAFKTARQILHDRYRQGLLEASWIHPPPLALGQEPFWHLFCAQCDWESIGLNRSSFFRHARKLGFSFQVHYIPLHCQPILASALRGSNLAGALTAYQRLVSLPCYPDLSLADQDRIINWLLSLSSSSPGI